MSKEDFDTVSALARIEAKVDALTDSITKVVYALLAIVGATVGVEFLPNSPVDWYGATLFAQRFLSIASMIFLAIMVIVNRKNGNGVKLTSRQMNYLSLGLISLAAILLTGTINPKLMRTGLWFYIGSGLRAIYAYSFAKFAWCFRAIKEPEEDAVPPLC